MNSPSLLSSPKLNKSKADDNHTKLLKAYTMLNGNIIDIIEHIAPPSCQESWDNTGLQTGSRRDECSGVLLCVDVTPDVIEEAHRRGCSLVLSHHPLIFKGLKRLAGNTPVEKAVMAAIRYGITVYSSHTALDSVPGGVSYTMASMLGARVLRVLEPLGDRLCRIEVSVDGRGADLVRLALSELAGGIAPDIVETARGEYCTAADALQTEGDPATVLSATLPADAVNTAISRIGQLNCRMLDYRVTRLSQVNPAYGLGVQAVFDTPVAVGELISRIKTAFNSPIVRTTAFYGSDPDFRISRIGICGGAGGEFIPLAAAAGCQAYLCSDIRYHDFVDWQQQLLLLDIGHFESESCTKQIFYNAIKEKFPNFAVYNSELDSNPIKYQ